jgi:hypothetical protein
MHLKNVKTMNKEINITMKELAEHFRQEQPHLMRYACYRLGDADEAKFQERRDGGYVGTYVFYTLTHPDGEQEQKHIAVRNDNEKHIWIADGGL